MKEAGQMFTKKGDAAATEAAIRALVEKVMA
jgi:hypothetical protein